MKGGLLAAALAALLAGCTTAAGGDTVPNDLLDLYGRASAYHSSASARICADQALRPRFEAAAARLDAARRALSARYADPRLDRPHAPIFTDRTTLCTNAAAAGTAVSGFEDAVTSLEERLN